MQRFAVQASASATHEAGETCAACVEGYPTPCRRIMEQAIRPVSFDEAGLATGHGWVITYCAGFIHAERGAGDVLETRCSACGVPP